MFSRSKAAKFDDSGHEIDSRLLLLHSALSKKRTTRIIIVIIKFNNRFRQQKQQNFAFRLQFSLLLLVFFLFVFISVLLLLLLPFALSSFERVTLVDVVLASKTHSFHSFCLQSRSVCVSVRLEHFAGRQKHRKK